MFSTRFVFRCNGIRAFQRHVHRMSCKGFGLTQGVETPQGNACTNITVLLEKLRDRTSPYEGMMPVVCAPASRSGSGPSSSLKPNKRNFLLQDAHSQMLRPVESFFPRGVDNLISTSLGKTVHYEISAMACWLS